MEPKPNTDHAAREVTTPVGVPSGKNLNVSGGALSIIWATPPALLATTTATTTSPATITTLWTKSDMEMAHMPPAQVYRVTTAALSTTPCHNGRPVMIFRISPNATS